MENYVVNSKDIFLCVGRKRPREPESEDSAPPVIGVKCENDTEQKKPLLFRLITPGADVPIVHTGHTEKSAERRRHNILSEVGETRPKLTVTKISTNNGLLVDCTSHCSLNETYMYKLDVDANAEEGNSDFDFDGFTISEPKAPVVPKRPRCDDDVPVFIMESVPRSKVRKLTHHTASTEQMEGTISLREFVDDYQNDYVEDEAEECNENYMYYDHRKDDEFDSNAEDFSGNDYPQNADEGSSASRSSVHDSECSERTRRRPTQHYGMFYEDEYEERPLSEGWSSDDQ